MGRPPAQPRGIVHAWGADINAVGPGLANTLGRDNRERGGSRKSRAASKVPEPYVPRFTAHFESDTGGPLGPTTVAGDAELIGSYDVQPTVSGIWIVTAYVWVPGVDEGTRDAYEWIRWGGVAPDAASGSQPDAGFIQRVILNWKSVAGGLYDGEGAGTAHIDGDTAIAIVSLPPLALTMGWVGTLAATT